MPQISAFYGIVIYMYYRDHPPPHFHAIYAGAEVEVAIDPPSVMNGMLPPRALAMVMEWAELRQKDLLRVWNQARASKPLDRVKPLQ